MQITGKNLSITYLPTGWNTIRLSMRRFVYRQKSYYGGLKAVNCEFGKGVSVILGPNGAGKTTLLKILAGLIVPKSGQVAINGQTVGPMDLRGNISYLPQKLGLYPQMTVREQLNYIALLKGFVERRERERRVEMVLRQTGLAALSDQTIKNCSRGTVQKVGIAQALLGEAALLLDEPTAGLDPEARNNLRSLFAQIGQERPVILASSLLSDVCCADLVLVLDHGQKCFMGTASELAAYDAMEEKRNPAGESFDDILWVNKLEQGYRAVLAAGVSQ